MLHVPAVSVEQKVVVPVNSMASQEPLPAVVNSNPNAYALQAYQHGSGSNADRRVHLDDLSGVLELVLLVSVWWCLRALRRKQLGLAQFSHVMCMGLMLMVGGHFLEEHVLGPAKLEALLRFGFRALCKTDN